MVSAQPLTSRSFEGGVELGDCTNKEGLLESVDEVADAVLTCGVLDGGKLDMTFCGNAGLVLLNLLFLLPSCLCRRVNKSQRNADRDV